MPKMKLFSLILLLFLAGCQDKPAQTNTKAQQKEPKLVAIEEAIAKTTPEGKKILEKAQGMKPEINGQKTTKALSAVIDNFAKNKSSFNILPIGWSASQKKSGRWKVMFHYQEYTKQYQDAEWEYNPETDKLYPFEKDNAMQFYSLEKEAPDAGKGKK